jgi:hypothetical protein
MKPQIRLRDPDYFQINLNLSTIFSTDIGIAVMRFVALQNLFASLI